MVCWHRGPSCLGGLRPARAAASWRPATEARWWARHGLEPLPKWPAAAASGGLGTAMSTFGSLHWAPSASASNGRMGTRALSRHGLWVQRLKAAGSRLVHSSGKGCTRASGRCVLVGARGSRRSPPWGGSCRVGGPAGPCNWARGRKWIKQAVQSLQGTGCGVGNKLVGGIYNIICAGPQSQMDQA